jgi:hypothetical protein
MTVDATNDREDAVELAPVVKTVQPLFTAQGIIPIVPYHMRTAAGRQPGDLLWLCNLLAKAAKHRKGYGFS